MEIMEEGAVEIMEEGADARAGGKDATHEATTHAAGAQLNSGALHRDSPPLKWWKEHAAKFPYLSQLARRYLAMPATSASVERLFSVAGQVVTAKRASLDPETVTLLVFLHEAIPGGIEREAFDMIDATIDLDDD